MVENVTWLLCSALHPQQDLPTASREMKYLLVIAALLSVALGAEVEQAPATTKFDVAKAFKQASASCTSSPGNCQGTNPVGCCTDFDNLVIAAGGLKSPGERLASKYPAQLTKDGWVAVAAGSYPDGAVLYYDDKAACGFGPHVAMAFGGKRYQWNEPRCGKSITWPNSNGVVCKPTRVFKYPNTAAMSDEEKAELELVMAQA